MLINLVEVNGKIEIHAAKSEGEEVAEQFIDNLIEEATLREVYFEGNGTQLNVAYEQYQGNEEEIIGEVALTFKQFVDQLNRDFKIVRR